VYGADETQALAARARLVARAVVGLVLEEERAARFVHGYSTVYGRLGIAGEAERKAEFLRAIERESLLLVAARIERTLPQMVGSRFSHHAGSDAVSGFRQAFLTFLGGSLAWDNEERESFRKDLGMYLRLAEREGRRMGPRRGKAPPAGAFVDRCAFLVDPSMMTQAREAAARYQLELESCAEQAVRAAFRGLRGVKRTAAGAKRTKPGARVKWAARTRAKPRAKAKKRAPSAKRGAKKRVAKAGRRKSTARGGKPVRGRAKTAVRGKKKAGGRAQKRGARGKKGRQLNR
jgi:hypothetical protein